MRLVVFVIENIKRFILLILLIESINLIVGYLISEKFTDFIDYQFPNNMLLTYYSNFGDDVETYLVADYNKYQVEDVTSNVRGIDLSKITFIEDNSEAMKSSLQAKLNVGTTAVKQNIKYIYDSEFFNRYHVNIPLNTLDLDHLVAGKYPVGNQLLISEEFATELISQEQDLNSYQDLIDNGYQNYNISGVYSSSYHTLSDEIIMFSDKKTDDVASIVIDYDNDILRLLDELEYSYITSNNYSTTNYKLWLETTTIISSFIVFIVLMKKELISFKYICKNNNVSKTVYLINITVPILIIVILIVLINLMI